MPCMQLGGEIDMKREKCIPDDVDKVECKSSKMICRPLRCKDDDKDGKLNGLRRRKRRRDDIMSESICLFRKYLVRRSSGSGEQKRKIMEEESQVMKKKWSSSWTNNGNGPPRPLFPSELGACLSRPPSYLLERGLLPGLNLISNRNSKDAPSTTTSSRSRCSTDDDKGSGGQLTIFYAGRVNVYDHVPLDKAQAIMLLAGGTSLSKAAAIATETPPPPPPFHSSNCHISNNLKPAGLPMARRYSLQCFLAKRRGRIINKSPYYYSSTASPSPTGTSAAAATHENQL